MSALQDEKKAFMNNHGAVLLKILLCFPLFKKEKIFVRYYFVGVSCLVMLNCRILCQRTKTPRVYMNCP